MSSNAQSIKDKIMNIKFIKNMSLRTRLTLITVTILIVVCISLTVMALYNVNDQMVKPINDFGRTFFIEDGRVYEKIHPNNFNDIMDSSRHNLTIKVYVTMFLLFGLGAAAMYYFAGKALKPVTDFSKDISEINEYNLNKRLEVPETNDEIASLSTSFNEMITKIEKAFESQKRFSQNAAHELKTPLTTMMANIEVLEMDDNPSKEEYKEVVAVMKDGTERLIHLVDSLLKVNNKGRQASEEIDVSEMFDELIIELEHLRAKKNVSIEIKGNTKVYADINLMERLFSNILINALRYNIKDGKVDIIIDNEKIEIKDTGIGIDDKLKENIFEPFYCIDDSRSKKLGGTGLGLAIVKEILDQYQLDYKIKSDLGKGTSFIIYIKNISKKIIS